MLLSEYFSFSTKPSLSIISSQEQDYKHLRCWFNSYKANAWNWFAPITCKKLINLPFWLLTKFALHPSDQPAFNYYTQLIIFFCQLLEVKQDNFSGQNSFLLPNWQWSDRKVQVIYLFSRILQQSGNTPQQNQVPIKNHRLKSHSVNKCVISGRVKLSKTTFAFCFQNYSYRVPGREPTGTNFYRCNTDILPIVQLSTEWDPFLTLTAYCGKKC